MVFGGLQLSEPIKLAVAASGVRDRKLRADRDRRIRGINPILRRSQIGR